MPAPVLAALASVARRAHLLPRVVASLRPHVDILAVYLNGYGSVPDCVKRSADLHVLDPVNGGAEKKLHWAEQHEGIYLSCDDDFSYPEDYVPTMVRAVERWRGRAIVTAHGRVFTGRPHEFNQSVRSKLGIVHYEVKEGRWVNHGGTGVMAWDASAVKVPATWPERNIADMQVSLWAQRNKVPIWLVPHKRRWLDSFATLDPNGIFRSSQAEGHRRRNTLLQQTEWNLHTIDA